MHQAAGAIESTQREREDKAIDYVFKLLDIPWWYYVIAILLGVAGWQLWKKLSLGMLIAYFVLLLSGTVLIRTSSPGDHFQPELFWSWKQWTIQKNQILTNVIMFLPVGVLAGSIWRWKGLWVATGLSVLIEVLQLITARGLCEFDDVIHNCIGALIGIGIMMLVKDLVEMIRVSSSD